MALLGVVFLWILLCVLPGTPLINESEQGISRFNPLLQSLVAGFFILFLAVGWAYGHGAGSIKDHRDVVKMMSESMSDLAYYLVLAFTAAHFVAMFNWSNLGLIFAILGIFQAYLALGLIVGIAGIGVVTYRSVSERSQQIGMLRALGFRKSTVMKTMVTEISWISMLGLLNGAIVALAFHIALHRTFWEDQGADLILPWFEVITVVLGGWILVLVATLVPVRKATQITPSKALSSPD